MTEARLSVTLPEYETELAANQRTALRTAALLAAPIVVAFTLLDRASAPGWWLPLLGIRLVAAAALAAVARVGPRVAGSAAAPAGGGLAPRFAGAPVALAACAVAVICGTVEAAVFATGGAKSPYLTSNIAVLAGVGILIPLTARQSLRLQLLGLGIALGPVLLRLGPGEGLALLTTASYLVTIAVVAGGGGPHNGTPRPTH